MMHPRRDSLFLSLRRDALISLYMLFILTLESFIKTFEIETNEEEKECMGMLHHGEENNDERVIKQFSVSCRKN